MQVAPEINQFDKVPQALKDIPQWIVWVAVPKDGGKVDKVPHSAKNGLRCSVTKSRSYATYNESAVYLNKSFDSHCTCEPTCGGRFAGIGLCLTTDIGIIGIDLDDAFDQWGQLKEWARQMVSVFPISSYIEISPSGKGLRCFLRGMLPAGRRKINLPSGESVEMYDSNRFLTVTGNHWGAGREVPDAQEAIDALHHKWFAHGASPAVPNQTQADAQLLASDHDRALASEALKVIPADDREVWLRVGMAMKAAGYEWEDWDSWAAKSAKYVAGECEEKWKSFKRTGVTIGSIFHYARQFGFQFPRQPLAGLPLDMETPNEIDKIWREPDVGRFKERVSLIPSATSRTALVALLEPVLDQLATVTEPQAQALLHEVVLEHFDMTKSEIEPYARRIKEKRKTLMRNVEPEGTITSSREALDEFKRIGVQKDIHPAIDFVDGEMYFGVRIKEQLFFVSSERQLLDRSQLDSRGLRLQHPSLDYSLISPRAVERVLESEKSAPYRLFFDIRSYIDRFVFLADRRMLDLLTVWCMGTYVFPIFRYYPYLWLNADKGSGKTTVFEVIKPICFNGQMLVSPTPAVLFREVAANKVSLLIDEFERMTKHDHDVAGVLFEVLNVGYNKDGQVKRMEQNGKGEFKVKSYSAYSPKAFSGINNIDEVLRDRTIQVRMLRKSARDNRERYKLTNEIETLQQDLRDRLYQFALTYAVQIAATYRGDVIEQKYLRHLSNRELDLWEPLIAIMHVADPGAFLGLMNPLVNLSRESMAEKSEENRTDNDTTRVLLGLLAMVNSDVQYVHVEVEGSVKRAYRAPDVLEYLRSLDGNLDLAQKDVTAILRKLQLSAKQGRWKDESDRPIVYTFAVEELTELAERFQCGKL